MSTRYIDIHVLQTVPYANLNRDDLGSPKSVRFGGAERTRVSSQCWKRAVRLALEQASGDAAVRTRRLPLAIADLLRQQGWDEDLAAFAGQQAAAAAAADGLGVDAKTGETAVLLYLPQRAIGDLAGLCAEHRDELTALQASGRKLKKNESVLPRASVNAAIAGRNGIINLFGRMLAELPSSNVDGAVQVAHAFTTHDTDPEVDFFTAVDDLNPAEATGSGHMNSAEFSAGTFYRYASINIADLLRNLDGDGGVTRDLAADFLHAFITAMPGAKKNSTAPFTVPDLVYLAVREDRPVSLASAFEAPVRALPEGGYGLRSRLRLDEYAGQVYRLLGQTGLLHHAHASVDDKELGSLGAKTGSYRALVTDAVARVDVP